MSTPVSTCDFVVATRVLISRAASAERWAKSPHFLGDHGEALAAFAGACSLDPGVEGKQIGLEGNLVDRADDLADLLGRGFDVGHGGNRTASNRPARLDGLLGDGDAVFASRVFAALSRTPPATASSECRASVRRADWLSARPA